MSRLTGKTAFVTGANRGIGAVYVEALIEAGVSKVYAGARDLTSLDDLKSKFGERLVPVELDVTESDQVQAATGLADDVSVLVNNAGIAAFEGFITPKSAAAARSEMETNYFGVINMVQAFAPILKKNGGGTIINMSSIAAYVSFPVLGSYSASKAAVHSLTQGIRAELAAAGTFVAGVYPGPVETDMAKNVPMDKAAPLDVARAVLKAVEAGGEDIYPDPTSEGMYSAFRNDPKAVERQAGEMLPEA